MKEKFKSIAKNVGVGIGVMLLLAGIFGVIRLNYEFPALDFAIKALDIAFLLLGAHQLGHIVLRKKD